MASRKSYVLAAAVAFGVAAWMLSDNIFGTNPPTKVEVSADSSPANTQQFIVSAVLVKNEPIVKVVRANGFSEADFIVTVSGKASGEILEVSADEGNEVKKGDVLVRLDQGTLP